MTKILLIIDPQIDFVNGALAVNGAEDVMNRLAAYVANHGSEYRWILVTTDMHPVNHCSFMKNGGRWPVHCVAGSEGSRIWPALDKALSDYSDKVIILSKGEMQNRDEYSIFKNAFADGYIRKIVAESDADDITVCGIAGDICVSDTLIDGIDIYGPERFSVIPELSPSIDDGDELKNLISKFNLRTISA